MKRIFLVTLAILMVVALILGGCGKPAPVKPIEMKLSTHNPPGMYRVLVYEQWAKEIETRTGGRVKITIYPAATLGPPTETWNMVKGGVCEIGWIIPSFYPGAFPLTDIVDLPYLTSGIELSDVDALFDKYYYDQMAEAKVLWADRMPPQELHTAKKPVRTMEDMKGLQIRSAPGPFPAMTKLLGGTPVTLPPGEVYSAIERGMIDGTLCPFSVIMSQKLWDVIGYHTVSEITGGVSATVMNLEVWNSLPPDIQKIFEELSPWAVKLTDEGQIKDTEECFAKAKEVGNEIIYLTPEERARWVEVTKPVIDEWAAKMDAKGLPGTEIINFARQLMAD